MLRGKGMSIVLGSTALALLFVGPSIANPARAAGGQSAPVTCSVTPKAATIVRIDLIRLPNGQYSHRGYDDKNRFVCNGEWSATPALNREAAEILRAKGNDRAVIVDRIGSASK